MDLHTFEMKMVDHHFAELPGGIQLFKRKHGRQCVRNSETDEEKEFDSLQAVLPYKPAGDKIVKELIECLDTMDSRLDGGRDAGSGQVYKFEHAFEGVAPAVVSQLITLIMEPDISVAEGACVDITFSESKRKHYIPKEIYEYYDPE